MMLTLYFDLWSVLSKLDRPRSDYQGRHRVDVRATRRGNKLALAARDEAIAARRTFSRLSEDPTLVGAATLDEFAAPAPPQRRYRALGHRQLAADMIRRARDAMR